MTRSAPAQVLRDPWLVSLCASRTFMNVIGTTYAATLPVLRTEWNMTGTAAGSIATGFQLGFAVSLLGFSWLADHASARRVFLASAALSAAAVFAFALLARSYLSGLILNTLVGLSQGGTYTTAIMLIADRYGPTRRGAAVGWLIASSSLGYALSLALAGITLPRGGYPLTFLVTACAHLGGVIIAWLTLRSMPNVVHPRGDDLRFVTEVVRNPDAMRLTIGYTFHNWELLTMWAWTPAFLAASFAAAGSSAARAVAGAAYLAASFHLMGLIASSTMGRLSDRLGRRTVLLALAVISAACSFAFGWMIGWPTTIVVAVGALYAFAALGDSPVLSAALTEAVRPAYLGSALALRSFLGFGAGAVAPLVFGAVLDATNPAGMPPSTWGWAYGVLGCGGLVAALCAYGMRSVQTRQFEQRGHG
ncbi:MAG: MFS transporter [Armatimonadota bacterium]